MTMNSNKEAPFSWPTVAGGWHRPGNPLGDVIDGQVMRLQHLTEEIQKVYSETCDRQIEVLSQTNDRLTQCVKEVMSSQGATDLLNAESHLASAWLDGIAARSNHWLALGQALQQCCADFARASLEDFRKQSEDLVADVTETVADTNAEPDKQFKPVKAHAKHAA